jgi:hypothetical protein
MGPMPEGLVKIGISSSGPGDKLNNGGEMEPMF